MGKLSTLVILGLLPFVAFYYFGEVWFRMMGQTAPVFSSTRASSLDDIPDMTGKVVVITGGNVGLGFESALQLAKKGATVVIGSRDAKRGAAAVASIKAAAPKAPVEVFPLELGQFASVRTFADSIKKKYSKLDVLMLNAGKLFEELVLVVGDYEQNIGVHHLGHAYLTFLLLPLVVSTREARIVVVSSGAHSSAPRGIEYDTLHKPKSYSPLFHYGQSKLANLYFTRSLARELQKAGIHNVFVNALHPGMVVTEFSRFQNYSIVQKIGFNVQDGAMTQIHVAAHPDIVDKHITGEYFYPIAARGSWGWNTSPATIDWKAIDKFWDWTLETLRKLDPKVVLSIKLPDAPKQATQKPDAKPDTKPDTAKQTEPAKQSESETKQPEGTQHVEL